MFFSLNPGSDRDNGNCTLSNGTIVYYRSDRFDCNCLAPIKADPDFAGAEIITSFLFLAWITIFIAGIPTIYALYDSWICIQGTGFRKFWTWFVLNLEFEPLNEKTVPKVSTRPPSVASLSGADTDSTKLDDIHRVKSQLPAMPIPNGSRIVGRAKREPPYCKWARRVVLQLCDIQIITGISILVSALSQYRHLTFYHAQFATQFWWLTLNSFWISRIDYSRYTPEMSTMRANARRIGLWISVALSIGAQSMVTYREDREWNAFIPGKCYSSDSGGTSFGQNMFWLLGTCIYFVMLSVSLFSATRKIWDAKVNEKLVPSVTFMYALVTKSQKEVNTYRKLKSKSTIGVIWRYLRTGFYGVAWLSWIVFILFITIWCAGNSAAAFELGLYSVFAGFLTWWILFLKIENKRLVQGAENRFTMGQSLPLFLILLVFVHSLDVWAGVKYEQQHKQRIRQITMMEGGRQVDVERLENELDQENLSTDAMAAGLAITRPLEPMTPIMTPTSSRFSGGAGSTGGAASGFPFHAVAANSVPTIRISEENEHPMYEKKEYI